MLPPAIHYGAILGSQKFTITDTTGILSNPDSFQVALVANAQHIVGDQQNSTSVWICKIQNTVQDLKR